MMVSFQRKISESCYPISLLRGKKGALAEKGNLNSDNYTNMEALINWALQSKPSKFRGKECTHKMKVGISAILIV
jgi:hypothetical protein